MQSRDRAYAVRKPRADGVATRQAILAAAVDEFAEKGYGLASTRAICARAGVNPALVNRYFGTKDDLYRSVAQMLFGDLGKPLVDLPAGVHDATSWREAIRRWVDAFLFMTLPTARAQRQCAALFRHEVTHPTSFHAEFRRTFGKPVFDSLRRLLAMALSDEAEIDLWVSAVWSQVSVYALADRRWHAAFRPRNIGDSAWSAQVCDFVCCQIFRSLSYRS